MAVPILQHQHWWNSHSRDTECPKGTTFFASQFKFLHAWKEMESRPKHERKRILVPYRLLKSEGGAHEKVWGQVWVGVGCEVQTGIIYEMLGDLSDPWKFELPGGGQAGHGWCDVYSFTTRSTFLTSSSLFLGLIQVIGLPIGVSLWDIEKLP